MKSPDDTIVIKAPAGTKARWVKQSQSTGMKLSDFVVERVDMLSKVFDVTLHWHDGGSLFLGSVYANSREQAESLALDAYIKKNKRQAQEIENGGGFQIEAELMPAADAAQWLARWSARDLNVGAKVF